MDGVCDWGLGDGWVREWWVVGGGRGEGGLDEVGGWAAGCGGGWRTVGSVGALVGKVGSKISE